MPETNLIISLPDTSAKTSSAAHVARITINRVERRNALDHATWLALGEACKTIAARDDIRAVVLTGAGEHFSAGADIRELNAHIQDASWMLANQSAIAETLDAFAALPQPTIAAISGACVGGGAALAAASDFRVCTPDARFAITPAKLGLTYRLVDCLRVVALVGESHTREILLLAKEMDAATAMHWGFVNEVVGPHSLTAATDAFVEKIVSLSSYSQRGIKESLLKIRNGATKDDEASISTFRDAFIGADFQEGAAAFIEKRKAEFK
jgi:enoyl-CoA hydratase